ncbi:MAG: hypothetical protein QOH71_1644 [Blastocatellia bacterium]|jgi:hypothetical protein|nr:hypothetical protein [Blastocatellia bacterium]
MVTTVEISNPKVAAERGEKIYNEKYKTAFEAEHYGKFVAIDVMTDKAYVADSPEEAIELARKENPKGIFHLVKVGSTGAFRVSYTTSNANLDWLFQ